MLRIVKLHIKPEKSEEFANIFRTHQPKLMKLSGCKSVTLVRDRTAKEQFMTISEWVQQADLDNYRNSALFLNVWQKVKPLFTSKAEVQSFDVLSSVVFKKSI